MIYQSPKYISECRLGYMNTRANLTAVRKPKQVHQVCTTGNFRGTAFKAHSAKIVLVLVLSHCLLVRALENSNTSGSQSNPTQKESADIEAARKKMGRITGFMLPNNSNGRRIKIFTHEIDWNTFVEQTSYMFPNEDGKKSTESLESRFWNIFSKPSITPAGQPLFDRVCFELGERSGKTPGFAGAELSEHLKVISRALRIVAEKIKPRSLQIFLCMDTGAALDELRSILSPCDTSGWNLEDLSINTSTFSTAKFNAAVIYCAIMNTFSLSRLGRLSIYEQITDRALAYGFIRGVRIGQIDKLVLSLQAEEGYDIQSPPDETGLELVLDESENTEPKAVNKAELHLPGLSSSLEPSLVKAKYVTEPLDGVRIGEITVESA